MFKSMVSQQTLLNLYSLFKQGENIGWGFVLDHHRVGVCICGCVCPRVHYRLYLFSKRQKAIRFSYFYLVPDF